MPSTIERLVQEALLLPSESRIELVEAILEGGAPSSEFIEQQMPVVLERMASVRDGRSKLVRDEDAHRLVREALGAGR